MPELKQEILTPSQVGQYLKGMMEGDQKLSNLLVRGEISNYTAARSGHHYFSLKDEEGIIQCVMYRSRAQFLRFRPRDGMQVIAGGQVTVYVVRGAYQMICSRLIPEGVGEMALAFEQMKEALAREGLFDPAHKKPLPAIPKRIALITSLVGDAVHDMIQILGTRWPMAQVIVIPVLVQGAEAPNEIAAAIRWADRHRVADVLIVGRGGGSVEDLWTFNEEIVARAIYSAETPIISAVGHEQDVTVADLVADLRARTPSHAAEEAVPDQNAVREILQKDGKRLERAMANLLFHRRQAVDRLAGSRSMTDPDAYFREKKVRLNYDRDKLVRGLELVLTRKKTRLERLAVRQSGGVERTVSRKRELLGTQAAALDAMSPLKVLGRGYAVARRKDGRVLSSVQDTAPGDAFRLRLCDGELGCRVEEIRKE